MNYVAVLLLCKRCGGKWITDEDDMKCCDYCEAKWDHDILWKQDTGVSYK